MKHSAEKAFPKIILEFFDYQYARMYLIFSLGLNGLSWIASYYIATSVDSDLIILHYNVNFGIDAIGEVSKIYNIPFWGLGIIVFNLILAFFIRRTGNFIIHVLLFSSLVANIFLLISLGSLYLVNFG